MDLAELTREIQRVSTFHRAALALVQCSTEKLDQYTQAAMTREELDDDDKKALLFIVKHRREGAAAEPAGKLPL